MIRVILFTETNSIFGYRFLDKLHQQADIHLVAVVTRQKRIFCDYYINDAIQVDNSTEAARRNIPVFRPLNTADPEFLDALRLLKPDYLLVANYQLKLGPEVLAIPTADAINFHPSPLPRYAGLAPFHWMAQRHETKGGVSAIRMGAGLDDGEIIAQQLLQLDGTESSEEIRQSHFEASWRLLDLILPTLVTRTYRSVPQDLEQRTYYGAPKI